MNIVKTNRQLEFTLSNVPKSHEIILNPSEVGLGQKVLYLGNVSGGPTRGTKGVVERIYAKKAVVDMGLIGKWSVPYYFLGVGSSVA